MSAAFASWCSRASPGLARHAWSGSSPARRTSTARPCWRAAAARDPRSLPAVRGGAAPLHRLLLAGRAGRSGHPAARAARRDSSGARGSARPGRADWYRRRAGALPPVRGGLRAACGCCTSSPAGAGRGRPALGRSVESAAAPPPRTLGEERAVDGPGNLPAGRGRRRASARRSAAELRRSRSARASVIVGARRGRGR